MLISTLQYTIRMWFRFFKNKMLKRKVLIFWKKGWIDKVRDDCEKYLRSLGYTVEIVHLEPNSHTIMYWQASLYSNQTAVAYVLLPTFLWYEDFDKVTTDRFLTKSTFLIFEELARYFPGKKTKIIPRPEGADLTEIYLAPVLADLVE